MKGIACCIVSLALAGACQSSSVPSGTSPAPGSTSLGPPPTTAVEEQQRLQNAVDGMPSPAAPFIFASKTLVRGNKDDVRLRYNGPDSIYVDVYVYALQSPHPLPCAATCIDSLAEQDFREYSQVIPLMIRAKYWDEIAVVGADTIPPPRGSPWQSARRIRMVARRNGKTSQTERVTFYYPAYRIEVRVDLPQSSPHQAEVDAFILDFARRAPR
jgi:hypothetical protein